jgi:hypothetical protein
MQPDDTIQYSDQVVRKAKFGFLEYMESRSVPLVLVRGGYWTFSMFDGRKPPEWYTDIDIVSQAERLKLITTCEVHPTALTRTLTAKGREYVGKMRLKRDRLRVRSPNRPARRQPEESKRLYRHRFVPPTPPLILADHKGVWLGPCRA